MMLAGVLTAWLGLLAPAAAPSLDACEAKRSADPEHWAGYTCYYVYARKTGDYEQALGRVRALVADEPERTWARYILADLLMDSGLEGASALYREVSAEFEEQGVFESAALSRVAYAFSLDADHDVVRAELQAAADIAARSGDAKLVAQVRVQQARLMLRDGGPLGQVAQLLADARAATFPDGPYEHKKHILFLEADLAQLRDRLPRARDRLVELRALAEDKGDRYVATAVEVRLIALEVENPPLRQGGLEALGERVQRIDQAPLDDNPYARAQYLCLRGDLELQPEAARSHYEACSTLAAEVGAWTALTSAQHGLALLDDDESRLVEARDRARARGELGLFSQHLVARVRFSRGDSAGGRDAAFALFDAIDRVATRQGEPLTRAQLLSSMTPYYDEAASWILGPVERADARRVESALQAVERLRARTIADALEQAEVETTAEQPPELVELGRRIAEVNNELRSPDLDDTARARLFEELEGLERGEAAMYDRWAGQESAADTLAADLSLQDIQAQLGPGHAILSYQVARPPYAVRWENVPARSWVAVITASSVSVHPIAEQPGLASLVELFVGAIADPDTSVALGHRLYETLLHAPLASLGPEVERLTIIPDGALHRIPFAALGARGETPLGERFSIARAPSLAIWRRLRSGPTPGRGAALALVEPEVDDPRLDPLTSAHREGEVLASVVATELRRGLQASEAFFAQAALEGVSVVHFGAHAVVDELHPDRAAVVLAPGSAEHDGLLQPRELAARRFDDALVVLASCRSAAGPIVAEEGPMGLAHALFRGGARTVVASLWPLDDAAATAFFSRFYEVLGSGTTVTDAVAITRRDLQTRGYGPEIWAGIVVLGDGDFVPLTPEPLDLRWLGWVLLAGLAAGVAALARRR